MRSNPILPTLEPLGMWKLAAALLVLLFLFGVRESRHYILYLDNFGVVHKGAVYRGGQLRSYQLEKLIEKLGLRTVINLREPDARVEAERIACLENGVQMVRLPMAGDGRGTYEQYEDALFILRDTRNLPALVHCARGVHRTGAVIAAYRVHVEGWDANQALQEMQRYKFKPQGHPLVAHLRPFLAGKD